MKTFFEKHLAHKQAILLWVTLIGILIPLIHIGEYHLLLFNFPYHRFEFLFTAYEVGIGSLIAIFVLFAVGVILVMNFTFARYFCGRICPKTLLRSVFTDVIEAKLFGILKLKQRQNEEEKIAKNSLKTVLAYLLLGVLIVIGTVPFFFYFMPAEYFFHLVSNQFAEHPWIGYAWAATVVYLFAEILFFKEFFCGYLCPYQLVHSITVHDAKSYYRFHDNLNQCIQCDGCVRVCPVPQLDIKKGFDVRCIACGDCEAVCADVMQKEGHTQTLIPYTDASGRVSKPWFSFSDPKLVIFLTLMSLILIGVLIGYFASSENLESCLFINKALHQ